MHDRLFAHQAALGSEDLSGHAAAVGLNLRDFGACLESRKHEAEVRRDIQAGVNAGVRGTPTFVVGFTDPDAGEVTAMEIIRGAQPFAAFKQAIDKVLAAGSK